MQRYELYNETFHDVKTRVACLSHNAEDLINRVKEMTSTTSWQSLTPIVTTSTNHLRQSNLLNNTVIVFDKYQQDKETYYRRLHHIGNSFNRNLFKEPIHLKDSTNPIIILAGLLSDWKSNGLLHRGIIQISLKDEPEDDELVLLMVDTNKWFD